MFYSDQPIKSNQEDQLSRGGFASLLAQSLLGLNSEDTFSVGLFGKWGSGKTSIVNMTLEEIDKQQTGMEERDKLIIVHFEPWNFSDTNQLLTQFFIHLSNEFKSKGDKNLERIGDALENYSAILDVAKLLPVVGEALAGVGKSIFSRAGRTLKKGAGSNDITAQKRYAIKLLNEQKSKILVVIDDIDRLSNEQIRQVFQLITSVARFPNTMYLLVFDKDVVVKALEKVQEGSGEEYLEKIIQMPIQIPDIRKKKLRDVLLLELEKILEEYKSARFDKEHFQDIYMACVDSQIKSIRDVNRLCNALKFKLATIAAEVDFADMVAITAIEIVQPGLYEWIKTNKLLLTGQNYQELVHIQQMDQKEVKVYYRSKVEDVLKANQQNKIDKVQTDALVEAVCKLFPAFGGKIMWMHYHEAEARGKSRVAHHEKFDRYFQLTLDENDIKRQTVLEVLNVLNSKEIQDTLLRMDKIGMSYVFLEEIGSMINTITTDRAKIIFEALMASAGTLNNISTSRIISLRAGEFAKHISLDILGRVDTTQRFAFISHMLESADIQTLPSIATLLNRIELNYGRLAANGQEREQNKVITLDELLSIEQLFVLRTKEILKQNNLFDLVEWRMVVYLLECFDTDFVKAYITDALKDARNVLRYLEESVEEWTGRIVRYEIHERFTEYLTTEQVMEAIESQRRSGALFTLPENTQHRCAAFYLYQTDEIKRADEITQTDTTTLLARWQNELEQS